MKILQEFTEFRGILLHIVQISPLNLQVERSIEKVKRNKLFQSPLPLSLAGSANQLWTVACLLSNFQGPLIANSTDAD